MTLHAPTDAVLYRWLKPKALTAGSILLTKELSKDTRWAECLVAGPDSVVKAGDEILLSARPVSYTFEIDGEIMHNTSDKSCLAYKHEGILNATGKTILYTWLEEPQEEVSAGGIVLVRKEKTKELEPRWAKVVACGPETGVQKGDEVLLAWKSDNYVLEIDGLKLHNAGAEEIIAFRR